MKKEFRIPTLLGLFLILIGLVATAFLVGSAQRFFLKAGPSAAPKDVKITNISDTSFSVSFTTPDAPVSAAVSYGESASLGNTANDDRVQAGATQDRYTTHHITLRFLKASTKYFFKIISGTQTYDNQGVPYSVVTAPGLATVNSAGNPVYGTVLKTDKSPAVGAIVYLTVNNSSPLSALVKSSGSWLITLNNVRTADLSSYLTVKPNGDPENIFVQGGFDGVATAQTVTGNDAPVPAITLGQTYNFTSGQPKAVLTENSATSSATPSPTPAPLVSNTITPTPTVFSSASSSGFISEQTATSSATLISPGENSVLNDTRPTFTGVGVPGQTITITVHSDTAYSATVVVGPDGRWSWTPPGNLSPGDHTVTIASANTNGQNANSATQNFTVLASGTSVTESATPSATLTPTFTPVPTLSASSTAIPVTGTTLPTYLLLLAGMVIIIIGFTFYAII
ncbi:MAG: Ig-like domain-containing protein [Patescibacteria group bacterium]|nr:Ig-like domain-containing protein [Patescibacteria group bacterium]